MSARYFGRRALLFALLALANAAAWCFSGITAFWVLVVALGALSGWASLHYLAAVSREESDRVR